MTLSKRDGISPSDGVSRVIQSTRWPSERVADLEFVEPGFLGLRMRDTATMGAVADICDHLSTPRGQDPAMDAEAPRLLVDYASPNLCKELHAGHLRSSVLGDTLASIFEDAGWRVTRVSHVGDWGTPVCTVITHLLDSGDPPADLLSPSALSAAYVAAKQRMDTEEAFSKRVHANVATLHTLVEQFLHAGGAQKACASGAEFPVDRPCGSLAHVSAFSADSPRTDALWRTWCVVHDSSVRAVDGVLSELGISVRHVGESSYATAVAGAMGDLERQGLLEGRGGAGVVYLRRDAQGRPVEAGHADERFVMLRRRGGGSLYATTDIATARWRAAQGYRAALYVVDARQAQHFGDVFSLAERAGWVDPRRTLLAHVPFGLVRGEGGAKLSSREGTELTLRSLLDGALAAARASLERSAYWDEVARAPGADAAAVAAEREEVARAIARSSLRYFEVAHNRTRDYEASFQRMVEARGNTAVALMYAVARVNAIMQRAGREGAGAGARALAAEWVEAGAPQQWHAMRAAAAEAAWGPGEQAAAPMRALAHALLQYPDALDQALRSLSPHVLADQLYSVASAFHAFYGACPVVGSGAEEASRLWLCAATAHVLRHGMSLIGVQPVQRM